ncbi:MAG TPA: flagellar biosynthesis anti-sigma factor FlgM [Novosphingobium sp.]|nr:flagellar biosynthesis anti-sigma factor FlgM [Novosphingobium sp.]
MPPIELGPLRPVGAVEARLARTADNRTGPSPKAEAKAAPLVRSEALAALDPGQPPVDAERVAQVRKAVESGTYPLVPVTVADAIIAAGVILRSGK